MRSQCCQHIVLLLGKRSKLPAQKVHFLLAQLVETLAKGDDGRNRTFCPKSPPETLHFIRRDLVCRRYCDLALTRLTFDDRFQSVHVEQKDPVDLAGPRIDVTRYGDIDNNYWLVLAST